ncbi:hypothetical protein HanPI659440_Chr12g0479921 [Helianthus annuus]|nr:hypothetical protein HanPI659440_Chr12g0479921 [Helianthus annuus]
MIIQYFKRFCCIFEEKKKKKKKNKQTNKQRQLQKVSKTSLAYFHSKIQITANYP